MRILTVGDSFTYGDELSDINNAWPAVLGRRLGYNINNLAKPGAGNTRMIRHCIENVNNYDMVIIAWSHYARIEVADEMGVYDIWPGFNPKYFKNAVPHRLELVEYITKHHNDSYLYQQYLLNILLLQSFLQTHNKRYLMLDSFGNISKREIIRNLIPLVNTNYYLGWPNETMMEWTYGCPTGPGGHFLEEGHKIVADKIYEHTRNLGWIS